MSCPEPRGDIEGDILPLVEGARIGRTRLGRRTLKCVLTIGTRSAQSIMARRQSDFARALTVGPATLNADQCAMARPCGLSPSRSSGIRIHAKAVNAADTRMRGASRLLNTC